MPGPATASTVPPNFEDQFLAPVAEPTGMAFTPDARLLMTSKLGGVYVYEQGALHQTPAINLAPQLCTELERGVQGVAVDPSFADSHHVYLYYTYDRGNGTCGTDWRNPAATPVNRISRFELGDDNTISPLSETVLVDNIPAPTGIHNAGDLQFGQDGYLYATVGDGGCDYSMASGCGPGNNAARYPHSLMGKVLRISSDGDVPPDNPHTGPGTASCAATGRTTPGLWCQEVYASGLRNPFRFAFDEGATSNRFFINDVGDFHWEEINEGVAGADYGWNLREGPCAAGSVTDCGPPPAGMTQPLHAYDHSNGCSAVTGGAFVPPGAWPSEYEGSYLFADIVCNKLFRLVEEGGGQYSATEFATDVVGPVAMTFGPPGAAQDLYYLAWGEPHGLYRLAFTGGANRRPQAVADAAPASGELPLEVQFDGSASSDPDGDALTHEWDFGDGTPRDIGPTVTHVYETAGTYTATLEVSDPSGAIAVDRVRIDAGNLAPAPSIDAPAADKLFSVGESILLTGSATDPEDGTLADTDLSWRVVKHHASHTHPYLPPTTGNDVSITAPFPENLLSTTDSYLEIQLTATDSSGLAETVTQELRPALVDLALESTPAGLRLEVNGATAPPSLTSWSGWELELHAPDPQWDASDQGQTFVSWSDGGAQRHTITTPASNTTYTARFTSRYVRPNAARVVQVPLVPAFEACAAPNRIHGPPLAEPSCAPPVQATPYTTVGTPDANGVPARSTGTARFTAIRGEPTTPENEADVRAEVTITGVLDRIRGADYYIGDLQARTEVAITDRLNGATAADSATVTEFPLALDMPCAPDLAIGGSTCHAVTTMNALLPGSVLEGTRAIWRLGQVELIDGGEDGDLSTPDNGLFATQGLFVP